MYEELPTPRNVKTECKAGFSQCGECDDFTCNDNAAIVQRDQTIRSMRKFIGKLSWELDLPEVSHSTEQDYIDAIQHLQKRAEDMEKERDESRRRIGCFNCRFELSDKCPTSDIDECDVWRKHWQAPLRTGEPE